MRQIPVGVDAMEARVGIKPNVDSGVGKFGGFRNEGRHGEKEGNKQTDNGGEETCHEVVGESD